MPDANRTIVALETLSDEIVGREGGFLAIRRLRMRNVRDDGSRSAPFLVDFLVRPKGVDAVVVAIYVRDAAASGGARVLLRDGLRPPLLLGRAPGDLPVPDTRTYLFLREVVAGIVEAHDRGEAGLRRRAAEEVHEEAGFTVDPADIEFLGAGAFPSPGAMAEKFWLCAVAVTDPSAAVIPGGDGSPMEEGCRITWMALGDAIAACVAGEIEDAKTELALRRLRDRLAGRI